MAPAQDWCVQCGANVSRNSRARASWYSAGALMAASAVLASSAAAAGIAALTKGPEPTRQRLVAQHPVTPPPAPTTPSTPVNPGAPETLKVKPTHATTASTTTSASHTTTAATTTRSSSTSSSTTTTRTTTRSSSSAGGGPIELQASQLSVYNPGAYPASALSDPRRAFEEGSSSLWTVKLQPTSTEHVGVGLLIDLRRARRIGHLETVTSTPGFGLTVYGANGSKPPAQVTDAGWTTLASRPALKGEATLELAHSSGSFRYVLLWITKAGSAGASGGQLSLEEVSLAAPRG